MFSVSLSAVSYIIMPVNIKLIVKEHTETTHIHHDKGKTNTWLMK